MTLSRKMLSRKDLREKKGIPWSRQHLARLVKQRKFPSPVKLGANTNSWDEIEIDDYIEARIAERDATTA